MSRFLFLLTLFCLAGCEGARPFPPGFRRPADKPADAEIETVPPGFVGPGDLRMRR